MTVRGGKNNNIHKLRNKYCSVKWRLISTAQSIMHCGDEGTWDQRGLLTV